MKKTLLMMFFALLVQGACAEKFSAPKKNNSVAFTDSTTTHTYEIDAKEYPIFVSKNGAYYIWKISKKTGNKYKYYLPKEIQIKLGRKYDNAKK